MKTSVFIGARRLTEIEAERLLPNFSTIKNKIEEFRTLTTPEGSQGKKEYNNTISILGERGTGKTSLLYTIENDLCDDIVLPIIKPDYIVSTNSITSNILGHLKSMMDDILKNIEIHGVNEKEFAAFFHNCIYKATNPLTEKFDEMYEYFCYTEAAYKALLINQYTNFSSYTKNSSKILNADAKFQECLCSFISELLNYSRKIGNKTKEPLLFIFIDDIDLRTTKVEEVLNALQSYANSNKVVTILSASYNTFADSLNLSLMSKDNLLPNMDIYKYFGTKNYINLKRDLAHEFMRKLMPPAHRYEIGAWDVIARANYAFYANVTTSESGDKTNAEPLMEALRRLFLMCDNDENIFFYKDNAKKVFPFAAFYNIFDSTARGLVNVFYSLHTALEVDLKTDEIAKFIAVKSLVDTIINSNPRFVDKKDMIYSTYLIWGNTASGTRIDYGEIKRQIEKLSPITTGTSQFEEKITIYTQHEYQQHVLDEIQFLVDVFHLLYFTNGCLNKVDYSVEQKQSLIEHVLKCMFVYPFLNGRRNKTISIDEKLIQDGRLIIDNKDLALKTCGVQLNKRFYGLFMSSYSFGLSLYTAFANGNLGEDFYKKAFFPKNGDELFYGFYNAVYYECSSFENKESSTDSSIEEFLYRIYLNADENLTELLNQLHDIAATPAWFDEGKTRIGGLIALNEGDSTFSAIVFSQLLKNTGLKAILLNLNDNMDKYIDEARGVIIKDLPTNGDEVKIIEKYIVSAIKQIVNLSDLHKRDNASKKVESMLNDSIKSSIDKIKDELHKLIVNSSERVITYNKVANDAINDFLEAEDGISFTKCKETKELIKSIIQATGEQNDDVFKIRYDSHEGITIALKNLSNNFRVWYGRSEARQTLITLNDYDNIELCAEAILYTLFSGELFSKFIKAYMVYSQKDNPPLKRNTAIIRAKQEFSPLMMQAFNQSVKSQIMISEEYDIEEHTEIGGKDMGHITDTASIDKY